MKLLYWQASVWEPAGHCALEFDSQIVSFWPQVVQPNESRPAPSFINDNAELEKFIVGIRMAALEDFQKKNIRLPSGALIYRVLFDSLSDDNPAELRTRIKSELSAHRDYLAEQFEEIQSAALALCHWLEEKYSVEPSTIAVLTANGKPHAQIDLNFVDAKLIRQRLSTLQRLGNLLMWYAKVGAKLDQYASTHYRPILPRLFCDKSGMRYYQGGCIRHNCASFVYDLLLSGGIERYAKNFSERGSISRVLEKTMRFNSSSKNEEISQKTSQAAGRVGDLSNFLALFGYGRHAITSWFGTTPEMLFELCQLCNEPQAMHELANHLFHSTGGIEPPKNEEAKRVQFNEALRLAQLARIAGIQEADIVINEIQQALAQLATPAATFHP